MNESRKMARLLAFAFALSASAEGLHAADRAFETAAGDSLTEVYEVDGVTIIHRRVLTNDVVAVNLYLLGGARQVNERTAGIEPLLLSASRGGTRNYPGAAAVEAEVRTGSRLVISAGPDWTIFGFRGLVEAFDSTWALFADRLMYPSLDSAAVELARKRMLTRVRASEDDPDDVASSLAASLAFSGHPYAHNINGTETSLAGITIEDLRTYLNEQVVCSRMLLVIVGNVTRDHVEATVRRTIGQLPRGDYVWGLPPAWASDSVSIEVQQRQLPTNYIVGYFAGPLASSEAYPDFRVAVSALSGWFFSRIREQGLSYAAGAYVLDRGASGGAVYVSTTDPESSIRIVNWVIERLKGGYYQAASLEQYAKGSIIGYYLSNQTNEAQADNLARGYLYRGELQTAADHVNELRSVEPHDVRGAADRYFKNIQFGFLGDAGTVPRRLMIEPASETASTTGSNIDHWSQVVLYRAGALPACSYERLRQLDYVRSEDALKMAVWGSGGDAAIGVIEMASGWSGTAIRFTDPECTW